MGSAKGKVPKGGAEEREMRGVGSDDVSVKEEPTANRVNGRESEIVRIAAEQLSLFGVEVESERGAINTKDVQGNGQGPGGTRQSPIIKIPLVALELGARFFDPEQHNMQNKAKQQRAKGVSLLDPLTRLDEHVLAIREQGLACITKLYPRQQLRQQSSTLIKQTLSRNTIESIGKINFQYREII